MPGRPRFTLTLQGAAGFVPGAFLLGMQRFMPPIDLGFAGFPGCFLLHDDLGVALAFTTDAQGCAAAGFLVPLNPFLRWASFYDQAVLLDQGAQGGVALSNGLCSLIQ